MPKMSRFVVVMLLISLMVSVAGSVFAQDQFCFNLNEADCELYHDLSEATDMPESAAFEMTIDTHMAGLDMPAPVDFQVVATGAYIFDTAQAEAAVAEFGELSVLDVSMGSILDLTDGVFSSLDAELNVQLSLPAEMGGDAFGPFDFWLVDGAGYMDFTPVGAIAGDPSLTGVMGVDLFDFIEVPLGSITMADIMAELDGMGDFDPSDFDFNDFEGEANPFENMFEQIMNPVTEADIAEFVKVTRLADENINGTDVVVFQTTVDVARMFKSEFIREQMVAQMEMQGNELPEDMDINELLDALAEAMNGSIVTVVEKFDTATGYGIATSISMVLNVDPAPLEALDGNVSEEEPLEFEMTIDFMRSDINQVQSIDLPADAQLIPVEMLIGEFF